MIAADFWTLLLGVGILAMFLTTVAMILGFTPGKKAARPEPLAPLRVATANAARERASAAARTKAAAAAREHGLHLTDVREAPAGQTGPDGDDHRTDAAVTPEEAEAIIAHYAENDPNRLAEVIIQWIKSDVKNGAPPSS